MENYLSAVVIKLRAKNHLTIHSHMGLAVQRLFKESMRRLDVPLTFEDTVEFQPYTVSGLMEPFHYNERTRPLLGKVKPGDTAWIRWVGLTSEVVAALNRLVETLPEELEIDKNQYWQVADAPIWDNRIHPWAGSTTYEKLWQKHLKSEPAHRLSFEFGTPTTFKSSGNWMPLPHPMLFFGSLDRRWSAFSPREISPELPAFIEYALPLNDFDGWTEDVPATGRKTMTGFMGKASFSLRDDHEAITALYPVLGDEVRSQYATLSRHVSLLGEYAFYGGVGSKSAMGMGMVRQV